MQIEIFRPGTHVVLSGEAIRFSPEDVAGLAAAKKKASAHARAHAEASELVRSPDDPEGTARPLHQAD
jgi:hypothetical protein